VVAGARQKYRAELKEARKHPLIPVLKHYEAPENRDEYLALAYAGNPPVDEDGELPAELEAELPKKFQRSALDDENMLTEEKQ